MKEKRQYSAHSILSKTCKRITKRKGRKKNNKLLKKLTKILRKHQLKLRLRAMREVLIAFLKVQSCNKIHLTYTQMKRAKEMLILTPRLFWIALTIHTKSMLQRILLVVRSSDGWDSRIRAALRKIFFKIQIDSSQQILNISLKRRLDNNLRDTRRSKANSVQLGTLKVLLVSTI